MTARPSSALDQDQETSVPTPSRCPFLKLQIDRWSASRWSCSKPTNIDVPETMLCDTREVQIVGAAREHSEAEAHWKPSVFNTIIEPLNNTSLHGLPQTLMGLV
mmetsp:Transcript_15428/g.23549  ORF Transcript_15428/g.23549 Transcript_15428/m.23549 type:complete len:104 (+) Transcript_15428:92-403(+)